jgi:hypothetical protein
MSDRATLEVVRLDHFVRSVINVEDFDSALHLTVAEAEAEFEIERDGTGLERTSLLRLAAEGVPAEVLRGMLGEDDSDAAADVGASPVPFVETIHDPQAIAAAMADTVESPDSQAPRKRGRPRKGS